MSEDDCTSSLGYTMVGKFLSVFLFYKGYASQTSTKCFIKIMDVGGRQACVLIISLFTNCVIYDKVHTLQFNFNNYSFFFIVTIIIPLSFPNPLNISNLQKLSFFSLNTFCPLHSPGLLASDGVSKLEKRSQPAYSPECF